MATRITTRELLRLRLASQRIENPTGESLTLVDVARQLLATQAQDFIQGGWALGLRAAGSTLQDLTAALESGSIIRSAPFRGTLHFMAVEDLGWVLALTAKRTIQGATNRLRQLDLDAATLATARDATIAALEGGRSLPRDEYFAVLTAAGIDPAGQRGYNVIWYLAQTGLICWGPPRGTQQGLVLLDEWMPTPRRLEGNEALRELVIRYFTGQGPATIRDLAWWSKVTLADARRGLELARPELTELECAGVAYWASTRELDLASGVRRSSVVHALPGFDEYLLGYQDRSAALAVEHSAHVVPGNNGIFLPMIVSRGDIVGTWRRTETAKGVTVTHSPFFELDERVIASFTRSAAKFARFRTA